MGLASGGRDGLLLRVGTRGLDVSLPGRRGGRALLPQPPPGQGHRGTGAAGRRAPAPAVPQGGREQRQQELGLRGTGLGCSGQRREWNCHPGNMCTGHSSERRRVTGRPLPHLPPGPRAGTVTAGDRRSQLHELRHADSRLRRGPRGGPASREGQSQDTGGREASGADVKRGQVPAGNRAPPPTARPPPSPGPVTSLASTGRCAAP